MNVKERFDVPIYPSRRDLLSVVRDRLDETDNYEQRERERLMTVLTLLIEDGFPRPILYDGLDGDLACMFMGRDREVDITVDEELQTSLSVFAEDGHTEFEVTVTHPEHLEPNDIAMLKAGLRSLLPA